MKQNLDEESVNGLVAYRIQRSKETLLEAKFMLDGGYFNGAINRLYYACYYIAIALLIKNGISAQKPTLEQSRCLDYTLLLRANYRRS